MREVVIVDSVRTGLAKSFRGKFNQTRPDDMAAHCVNALLARSGIDPASVEDCIVGAGSNEGAQGYNIGRNVAVLSRLGTGTAGMTLNRFCSSGLQAIAIAANQIASGCSDIIVAGGVESISLTMKSVNTDNLINPLLKEQVPGIYFPMGQTAEIVARRYNVSREEQDLYALQSQQRTAQAQAEGLFDDEIVAMAVKYKVEDKHTGEVQILDGVVDRDDCNRPDTTLASLSGLKPVFAEDGSVTAGNSSQLSDGASMTLVMSLEKALELGLKPKAFFRGFTVAGCEPDEMGIGPVFSVPKLLKARGLQVADIDLWELNEAFASQCLYARNRLEIDNARYNVNGGSISIGHPFGMTGSRQVGHLVRAFHILWTHVTVVDVVGVFPDVAGQQRGIAAGQRVAGADGACQGQGTVSLFHQPAPTGTEGADRSLGELFLELVERTESGVDRLGQCASRLAAGVWRQAVPVESVVPDLGGVVEDATRRGFDDLFQGLAFELGARHQVVQVHDIGVVVLVVVILQGFLGDVRLQGIVCVGQRRQFESHDNSPNQVSCGERKADHGRPNKRRGVCTLCGAGAGS